MKRTALVKAAREQTDCDVFLWSDDDMVWTPETALSLVEQCTKDRPVVGTVYAARDRSKLIVDWLPKTPAVDFFEGGRTLEVRGLGFGLIATHRSVFDRLEPHTPRADMGPHRDVPIFFSVIPVDGVIQTSDYYFCNNVRAAGMPIHADTRLRVGHVGEYVFNLEDVFVQVALASTLKLPDLSELD